MRKKIFFIIIFLNILILAHGNIYIVDTGKLPKNEAFNRNMETLFSINDFVNHYSPEWRYPVDKEQLIVFLTAFHNDINRINSNNDYELNLLDVVIMTYLYNLDKTEYFSTINEKITGMKLNKPNEYRSYWVLGNFLISVAKLMDGYNEFLQIKNLFNTRLENYPAYFLNDVAYACIMVQMFENALLYYELAAKIGGTSLDSNRMYTNLRNSFLNASVNNEYSQTDVWQVFRSSDRYYLRSRMFSSLFPLNPSWNINILGLNNRKSFCIITPERLISPKNNAIGITILIEYNLTGDSYENFLREKINMYPVISQRKQTIGNREYDILVYEDKSKYTNMDGMRGYYISTQLRFNNQDNASIELPIEINLTGENGASYYTIGNIYRRINQNINIGILVDSSVEIFDEATKFIFNFLNEMVIE
jgi:hypothetical protein